MEDLEIKKYEEMARISKALAHATRLFIIHKLDQQEYCVKDLTQMIGADISTVSKHLTVLKNAGIINSEKRGNCIFYKLQTRCVLNIFNCVMNVIQANKDKMNEI
ncbi:MAG: metalloregulator ArsR/SmtB family transcription factor [Candidatus Cloacimonetes bacterium]|nr:metalloregulator ArsR/SmtB family transcription factor [Candidatus Cloacimonadota bacterium]MCF7814654.1 metalloregulator ArsR/SmtB family transcription factor [Candidatus Cloacimonadota bacterium]MCF7869408.1 metalloregulator ArsR/SmtB family transcription factor [Candidatus Cloacimonadota bacterium]MCF7884560.1 metalloregulator ArsR/SmtB family transcription factor [Candidatus Cloacimonadota bacterium]